MVLGGRVTAGRGGLPAVSPPYFWAIETLVSQPSLPGTVNFWFMALVAGPAAAMPAMVRTIQPRTTIRLWASTHRVSDGNFFSCNSGGEGESARHGCARAAQRRRPNCRFAGPPRG